MEIIIMNARNFCTVSTILDRHWQLQVNLFLQRLSCLWRDILDKISEPYRPNDLNYKTNPFYPLEFELSKIVQNVIS